MASPKAIKVELGAQQASLQRHLESDQYDNASEVVRDALRALDERDAVYDEWLRAKVNSSMRTRSPIFRPKPYSSAWKHGMPGG
jgi:antitoxin ParD1/3/4